VKTIADQMWGSGTTAEGHAFGKGKVYSEGKIEDVLQTEGMQPDFTYGALENVGEDVPYNLPRGFSEDDLVYIHRHLPEEEIYFVATQKPHAFDVDVNFRIAGKEPELWHPDTGKTEPAAYTVKDGITTVPLHMDPEGSVFVIFREKRSAPRPPQAAKPVHELVTLHGPWRITFPPEWGAPAEVTFPELQSWTKSEDAGVKYFSGAAAYSKDVDVQPGWLHSGAPVLLDLGVVEAMAEVTVNGKPVGGVLWKPPFQVNVAPALHAGTNHIEIKVTNLWPNRMIGDLQPGVTKRYTFTDFHAFRPDSPLLESGLLGPVRLLD
jgi:hypothetical protein